MSLKFTLDKYSFLCYTLFIMENIEKVYLGKRLEGIEFNGENYTDFHRGFCLVYCNDKPLNSYYPMSVFQNSLQCFEWGYEGVLPCNLACSIVYDFYGIIPTEYVPNEYSKNIIKELVKDFVNLPKEGWSISEGELNSRIEKIAEKLDTQSELNFSA